MSAADAAATGGGAAAPKPGACVGCEKEITVGSYMVDVLGGDWHQACFRCAACNEVVVSGESFFTVPKQSGMHAGRELPASVAKRPVCSDCFEGCRSCTTCQQPCVVGDAVTLSFGKFHPGCFVCFKCKTDLNGEGKQVFKVTAGTIDRPVGACCIDFFDVPGL